MSSAAWQPKLCRAVRPERDIARGGFSLRVDRSDTSEAREKAQEAGSFADQQR